MKTNENFNDRPFGGTIEWYPYVCPVCNYKELTEEIIIDAFPPDGPGNCPILSCPKCENDFIRDIKRPTIMKESNPKYFN